MIHVMLVFGMTDLEMIRHNHGTMDVRISCTRIFNRYQLPAVVSVLEWYRAVREFFTQQID